jgi:hypothetical protein
LHVPRIGFSPLALGAAALKMTRGISSRLRETSAGGGGLRFGGVWTVLIVSRRAQSGVTHR